MCIRDSAYHHYSAGRKASGPRAMSVLKAKHLAKRYKSRQVVTDLSIEVNTGEVVGLLGPNGAGKTTAFYMIVGLVPCDAGTIHLDEKDITLSLIHISEP